MVSRKMEGNEQQKRDRARAARERGRLASAEGATTGASKQPRKVESKDHQRRLAGKHGDKLDSVKQKSPEGSPGYRDEPGEAGRGTRERR